MLEKRSEIIIDDKKYSLENPQQMLHKAALPALNLWKLVLSIWN